MTTILSPYAAARLANARLEEAGLSKRVRPQMMYNYTYAKLDRGEKPLIKATREAGVDPADFERWLKAYVAKQLGQVVQVADPEQAEFDASEPS